LIARAVVELPEVKFAKENGRLIVATSTTCAAVAEELLEEEVPRDRFLTGHIVEGTYAANLSDDRLNPYVLEKGEVVDVSPGTMLEDFEADDVFIKSANAVDPEGHAGILLWNPWSGTIGKAHRIIQARGSHLIVPVGLEKLIPSVITAAGKAGINSTDYALDDRPVGLFPLVNAQVITELQALNILTGVDAYHISSGGIGGSEGTVALLVEGEDEQVKQAMELAEDIKGEPPIPAPGE
jgi:hypothetical protein